MIDPEIMNEPEWMQMNEPEWTKPRTWDFGLPFEANIGSFNFQTLKTNAFVLQNPWGLIFQLTTFS